MTEKEETKQNKENKTVTIEIKDVNDGQVSVQLSIEPQPKSEEDYTPSCFLAMQLIEYLNVIKEMGQQQDSSVIAPDNDIIVP